MIENQSTILKVIDSGIYVVSIQPIASTRQKFAYLGSQKQIMQEACFIADYTYLIETLSVNDSSSSSPVDLVLNLFGIPNSRKLK